MATLELPIAPCTVKTGTGYSFWHFLHFRTPRTSSLKRSKGVGSSVRRGEQVPRSVAPKTVSPFSKTAACSGANPYWPLSAQTNVALSAMPLYKPNQARLSSWPCRDRRKWEMREAEPSCSLRSFELQPTADSTKGYQEIGRKVGQICTKMAVSPRSF